MHILVTGGAGFIGSNYVRWALENSDATITTLDALTYAGREQNLSGVNSDRHRFIKGDITDGKVVEPEVKAADIVVNFAAESHVDRAIEESRRFVETNIRGTQVLLQAAQKHGVDRFIQISTDEVYGEIREGRFSESDRLNPRNPYAATKAGADHLALSFYETHRVPVIVTRSANNYGPCQHEEKFIPKLIGSANRGENLPIYGDGSNVREWTYVLDNCRAIERVIQEGNVGEIYNIGSGVEMKNKEVAKLIANSVVGDESILEYVEDRPGHDQRYALNSSKVRDLGWKPAYSFEDGMKQTFKHYLNGSVHL
jgi:dTDP-glucose 4,6-dehydratase